MFGFLTLAHEHKFPNGPEIDPAFSSIFMFMVMFVLVKTLVFATCLYHGDVFWHLISIRIYEKFHKSQWKRGAERHHHDINIWQIPREATAPAILFHHFNLRTVFAVMNIA